MSFKTASKLDNGKDRMEKARINYKGKVHGKIRVITRYPDMPSTDGATLFKPTVQYAVTGRTLCFN